MTALSGVTAISFDVDNTLWDFDGVTRGALRKVLGELSLLDPEAARSLDVDRMIAIRNETQDRLRGRVNDLNAVREESMKQALREAGRPDDELGSHLTQVYFRHRDAARAPLPRRTPGTGASCAELPAGPAVQRQHRRDRPGRRRPGLVRGLLAGSRRDREARPAHLRDRGGAGRMPGAGDSPRGRLAEERCRWGLQRWVPAGVAQPHRRVQRYARRN